MKENTDRSFDIISNWEKIRYLMREEDKRKIIIKEIKDLQRPYSERLYRRIQFLDEDAKEEYPYQEILSVKSLEGFLKFMKRPELFKYPCNTMTPDGNIRIQWDKDKDHHLAIEFISDSEAKIVVFAQDPVSSKKTDRFSIRTSIDSIINEIAPFSALEWITE